MKISLTPLFFAGCLHGLCLFTPPHGWEPAQSEKTSQHVKIGFVGPGSRRFCPSIHLAEERVDCNLEEYLKAVKKVHLSEPNAKWRDLGPIQMKAGIGRLTEIRNSTPYGEMIFLQAIFLQEKTAYLLTGALSKDDRSVSRKELLSTFGSLNIVPDLLSAITEEEVRAKFTQVYNEMGQSKNPVSEWSLFQKMIQNKTEALGKYWQFLALQEGRSKIYQNERAE